MRTGSFDGPGEPDTVVYEGFRSSVQINAPGGWQFATARISIKGLAQDVMNRLTIINYVNYELQRNEVLVEATGPDGKYNTLFLGTIGSAYADYMGAPDVSFMIEAYQALQPSVDANPPTSWPGPQKVAAIAGELCKKIDMTLENNGVDVTVSDAYLSGSYFNQLRSLCETARCQVWIDSAEGVVAISPQGRPRNIEPVLMNGDLGLIGWPTPTHLGVDFMCLHTEASAMAAAFYCGREHAQAEYRAIKLFYDGKRANAPWWCGFERRAWNFKSMCDLALPIAVSATVYF